MRAAASLLAALAVAGAGLFSTAPAHALFEDAEARRAIIDLRGRLETQSREMAQLAAKLDRLEQSSRGQLELQTQIEALRQEVARLRGQLEVQANELAQAQRAQRDLFSQVDSRLKRVEPEQVQIDGRTAAVDPEERKLYEASLAQFRAGEFAKSAAGLQQLRSRWPESAYTANALFWQGSAQFALKDYKASIASHQSLLARFPDYPRAADAMLNVGYAQAESGDRKAARATLEGVVGKYPGSQAAQLAKDRLATLR
ncbi:MAG TPA: tol-pal system protein YbgF [Quisquiliibacterium sp.]|nr:tol-pal system protein YbgF [Quisquiliibacterium sp.]